MPTLAAQAETCAYKCSVESAVKRIYLFFVWQLDMSMRIWGKDNEDWWVMLWVVAKPTLNPDRLKQSKRF